MFHEDLDKWDILAGLIGVLAWFRGGEKNPAATDGGGKEKIISILQAFVSKVDEGMWASLIANLKEKQKQALTRLLQILDRFREKDSFCLTVVNMPVATTVIEVDDPSNKKKKIKKVVKVGEYSDEDTRVIFLRDIADLVDDPTWGPEKVRDMLRTHRLATENKVAKRALEIWETSLAWMNQRACAFFRVDNLDEITSEVLAKVLDFRTEQAARHINKVARQVPYRRSADVNQGFWRGNYCRSRVSTIGLALLITGALGCFIYLVSISHN